MTDRPRPPASSPPVPTHRPARSHQAYPIPSLESKAAPAAPPMRSVDPDVDLHVPGQRDEFQRAPILMLAVIALGGAIGACLRYGATVTWPTTAGAFPWTTLAVNGVGCALIGVLMVTVVEARTATHPLVRPFLGTGVLGGFTTFSTYAVDVERLLADGRAGPALGYLAATVAAALAAVWLGTSAARQAWRRRLEVRAGGGRR